MDWQLSFVRETSVILTFPVCLRPYVFTGNIRLVCLPLCDIELPLFRMGRARFEIAESSDMQLINSNRRNSQTRDCKGICILSVVCLLLHGT